MITIMQIIIMPAIMIITLMAGVGTIMARCSDTAMARMGWRQAPAARR